MSALDITPAQTRPKARRDLWPLAFVALAAALLVAPLFLYPVILMKALCMAIFACGANLLIGYVGLLSIGQAMFLGTAAYLAAWSAKEWGFPFEAAILFGTAAAALLGVVIGWLSIRRQGMYFAMVTLALSQLVYLVFVRAPFTGGENGIQRVPRGWLLGLVDLRSDMALYYVVAVIFFASFLLVFRIIHSPFGQVVKAIRENETRVISLGYKPHHYKLIVFVIAAALTGLAGALKAIVFQLAVLSDATWSTSGDVVLMTLMGGVGTVFGPLVGAFMLTTIEFLLSRLNAWLVLVQGVIFILCVLAFRRGVVGELAALFRKQPRTK
jgi:branched-chain amino acid transport system permease protein